MELEGGEQRWDPFISEGTMDDAALDLKYGLDLIHVSPLRGFTHGKKRPNLSALWAKRDLDQILVGRGIHIGVIISPLRSSYQT